MNTIWNVEADPTGVFGELSGTVLSFTMVLAIDSSLLVSLLLSTMVTTFGNYVGAGL